MTTPRVRFEDGQWIVTVRPDAMEQRFDTLAGALRYSDWIVHLRRMNKVHRWKKRWLRFRKWLRSL